MPLRHLEIQSDNPEEFQAAAAERLNTGLLLKTGSSGLFGGRLSVRNGTVFMNLHARYSADLEVHSESYLDCLSVMLIESGGALPGGTLAGGGSPVDPAGLAVVDLRQIDRLLLLGQSSTQCFTLPLAELHRRALILTGETGQLPPDPVQFVSVQAGVGQILAQMLAKTAMCFRAREQSFVSDFTMRQMEEAAFLCLMDMISGSASGRASGIGRPMVRTAIDIAKSSTEPMTVGDLAEALGVTARALQFSFKRDLGISPHDFLKQTRLLAVRREFEASGQPGILAIARRWGFSNASRFKADYLPEFGLDAWPHREILPRIILAPPSGPESSGER